MAESTARNHEESDNKGTMKTVLKVVIGVVVLILICTAIYFGYKIYKERSSSDSALQAAESSAGSNSTLAERGSEGGNGFARDSAFNLVNRKERA